jgi:hypothetical protein
MGVGVTVVMVMIVVMMVGMGGRHGTYSKNRAVTL